MTHTVQFEHDAVIQLAAIEDYIADQADPATAAGFVARIVRACDALGSFPHRGRARDDIRPGLRITGYRKRVTIAFTVDDAATTVAIVGVFYGGQDWETRTGCVTGSSGSEESSSRRAAPTSTPRATRAPT